jgi:7,8-dihydropterin-6-yl-methyl-4-(beta-D-ribofuranosyl)aminobenzene 5'-phosphate synthase
MQKDVIIINITILMENHAESPMLLKQHGLSIWLEIEKHRILFDTGQNGKYIENADFLGISIEEASHLFISHGHYDHTGGVPALFERGGKPVVIVHPGAWIPRRSLQDGDKHEKSIGVPWKRESFGNNHDYLLVEESFQFLKGIWTTGSIYEFSLKQKGINKNLQRFEKNQWITDYFPDEQALILDTVDGLLIVTGCTHTGIFQLLDCAVKITGKTGIYAVVGGLHLYGLEKDQVKKIAERLKDYNIQHLWVNHCTGEKAFEILKEELDIDVKWAGGGFKAEIPGIAQ